MSSKLDQTDFSEFSVKEHKPPATRIGLQMGIITSLAYVVILSIRYLFLWRNPMYFQISMMGSYIIILILYGVAAYKRGEELGPQVAFKDIFSTVFIVILFTEIIYTLFNFIYLNYIDPDFITKYVESTKEYLINSGKNKLKIEHEMGKLMKQKSQYATLKYMVYGTGIWIIIDSFIGLLISLIIKASNKRKY